MSRNMAAVGYCRFRLLIIKFVTRDSCVMVLCCCLNPCCSSGMRFKSVVISFSLELMIRSRSLLQDGSRLMGRWFSGMLDGLPGFGINMVIEVFQGVGKC